MKLRPLTLAVIVIIELCGSRLARLLAACSPDSTFSFQVERPSGAPATNVRLTVEVSGASGASRLDAVVNEVGNVTFCIDKDSLGKMVDVYVPANLRVMFPSRQRVPLIRDGSPSIVVCEANRDCVLRSEAEITTFLQRLQTQTRTMSGPQMTAMFHELQESIARLSRDLNADNEKLIKALARKERQVKAATQAWTLLRTFSNRARELLERFDRHAERVLETRSQRELDDISNAITAYNPVFDELSERADAYVMETRDYWSSEVSNELRSLFDEALAIHKQGIYPLNRTKLVIIDCIKKRPGPACASIETAHAAVQAARKNMSEVTLPRLERFAGAAAKWRQPLDDQLFEANK
jgi:hypothetical protein